MPFNPTYSVPEDRRAYRLDGGSVGCLMLHGFMGSPARAAEQNARRLPQRLGGGS